MSSSHPFPSTAREEILLPRWEFASDNTSGICPEAWEALAEANTGFSPSYGNDPCTREAANLFREIFETDCEVFFVFNGTAANSLALSSLCRSYHSVVCHESAHIETDECGAPEFFSNGTKILLGSGPEGKLSPDTVHHLITKRSDIHYPRARVLSLTQPTELGTVYQPVEIQALSALAAAHNLKVHMDGSRFAVAVDSLGLSPAEITWRVGVDVLCLGGTKSGIGSGEVILFFDTSLAEEFAYRCKQSGQLASKMRFLAAPWRKMLASGGWLQGAAHSRRCAQLLEDLLRAIPEVEILYPVQANSVFLRMPESFHAALKAQGWQYYVFIGGGARLMCSWDTREDDIRQLVADLSAVVASSSS